MLCVEKLMLPAIFIVDHMDVYKSGVIVPLFATG